eukprot:c47644_g1_i1 orf=276-548(+)
MDYEPVLYAMIWCHVELKEEDRIRDMDMGHCIFVPFRGLSHWIWGTACSLQHIFGYEEVGRHVASLFSRLFLQRGRKLVLQVVIAQVTVC